MHKKKGYIPNFQGLSCTVQSKPEFSFKFEKEIFAPNCLGWSFAIRWEYLSSFLKCLFQFQELYHLEHIQILIWRYHIFWFSVMIKTSDARGRQPLFKSCPGYLHTFLQYVCDLEYVNQPYSACFFMYEVGLKMECTS